MTATLKYAANAHACIAEVTCPQRPSHLAWPLPRLSSAAPDPVQPYLLSDMERRSFVFPVILLAGCGSAPQAQKPNVRFAVGGRAALDFIPVYPASALDLFRAEGIEVALQ